MTMSFSIQLPIASLAALVSLAWVSVRCVRALHMLQLDSYANDRLLKWLADHPVQRAFDLPSGLCHGAFIAAAIGLPSAPLSHALLLGAWSICGATIVVLRLVKSKAQKKPLVYTSRAVRILIASLTISLAVIAVGFWVALDSFPAHAPAAVVDESALIILLTSLVVIQLAPLTVALANLLLSPIQRAINRTYLRQAGRRLGEVRPLVIGITGSYGKTSTKYVLERLLADSRKVLKTPLSYNTLMGICRVINEELQPDHRIFVVEMGAYRRGDIRELCDLVHPTIGILTAVGPQHLERFKTIENVQATKYELIQALQPTGFAIFNNDDPRCRALADQTQHVTVLRYGLNTVGQALDLGAEEIAMGPHGLSFTMVDKHRNRAKVQTVLLGRHNVLNILGASCAALAVGLSLEEIAEAIRRVPPVPHRLQLIHGGAGATVIDDSYNSNPIGAMEALDVLNTFTGGRRILVTPGMVELGPLEAQLNQQLGARAADVCDYVILVGIDRTKPLLTGLQQKGFSPEKLRVAVDLAAATEALKGIVRAGDAVLFENDLPDLYG